MRLEVLKISMVETQLTLFDLPSDPEQIGVLLPPAKLRRIDFSALDFTNARRAIIEYVKTYYPDDFNDYVESNGMIMMIEIVASVAAKLALRSDLLANDAFLATAQTEDAVANHLGLINQEIRQQTSAVVDVEVSVLLPLTSELRVSPGLVFSTRGPDGKSVYYEIYRAPGDFTSSVTVSAGKRGVIAYGIEGRFASPYVVTSPGGASQQYIINSSGILSDPILVSIDGVNWVATTQPLEAYGSSDKVMNYKVYSNRIEFLFGDNVNGVMPLAGQIITIRYRQGGGVRGRIGSGAINETRSISPQPPASSPVSVSFRNLTPSSGGTDRETLDQAKKRGPRDFVVRAFASDRPASIVTDDDYIEVATTFSHPVYGTVSKAAATVRTGLNANLVEIYVLCDGPDSLVYPSVGLKQALKSYISQYNVATDSVEVLDGVIKAVDIDMTVVIGRNADATFVKNRVNDTLDQFFNTSNRDMGQSLFISELVEMISVIDGVAYVDLFSPSDNILSTGRIAASGSTGVGFNEMIVEGNRNVRFYYEKSGK